MTTWSTGADTLHSAAGGRFREGGCHFAPEVFSW